MSSFHFSFPFTLVLLVILAYLPFSLSAVFNISNVFSSNAVFKHDEAIPIWGYTNITNIQISVSFQGQNISATPVDGLWKMTLPPSPISLDPIDLTFVNSYDTTTITLTNILIGEVFLCSGQSNMGLPVNVLWNITEVVKDAAVNYPYLRLYQAPGNTDSSYPLNEFPTDGLVTWNSPIVNGSNTTLLGYSAACYIFGSTLYKYLNGTAPVGLVLSAHGGTSILTWISSANVNNCGDLSMNGWNASELYNSNVYPLTIGPSKFSGVVWYQGEEDVGIGSTETWWRNSWYSCSLSTLIQDWRSLFQNNELPFVVQQLHSWIHTVNTTGVSPGDFGLAAFRAMQQQVVDTTPFTGLSVAIDGGDPAAVMVNPNNSSYSPSGTVHPHCKYIPGLRMARTMMGLLYGDNSTVSMLPYTYPTYSHAIAHTSTIMNGTQTNITITVYFRPDSVMNRQLYIIPYDNNSNSSHCPTERGVNTTYCDWFTIQINDAYPSGTWYNVTNVTIDPVSNNALILNVIIPRTGIAPVATRNSFSDWGITTVYTTDGLPVLPWLRYLSFVH